MADGARREVMGQIVRYGVNGAIVTGFYSIIVLVLDSWTHLPLQICNIAGYIGAMAIGYPLHSRFTFRNHGTRDRGSQLRFFVAILPSYALNTFWVWLLTDALNWAHWTIYVPVWLVTPGMVFLINRYWVFR